MLLNDCVCTLWCEEGDRVAAKRQLFVFSMCQMALPVFVWGFPAAEANHWLAPTLPSKRNRLIITNAELLFPTAGSRTKLKILWLSGERVSWTPPPPPTATSSPPLNRRQPSRPPVFKALLCLFVNTCIEIHINAGIWMGFYQACPARLSQWEIFSGCEPVSSRKGQLSGSSHSAGGWPIKGFTMKRYTSSYFHMCS